MRAGADKSQAQVAAELEDRVLAAIDRRGPLTAGDLQWQLERAGFVSQQSLAAALRRLRNRHVIEVATSHPRLWSRAAVPPSPSAP